MAFVTPVVEHWLEREIAQWVHPMKDRSDDPSHHERTLLLQSYISLWHTFEGRKYFILGLEKCFNLCSQPVYRIPKTMVAQLYIVAAL